MPQKRKRLHIKSCLDQYGEGKLVNDGSSVTRLAGDPDLPRLVGRHVDLHAAFGCAQRKRWGGAPSMATVTKPSLSSLLTGRKTGATSPVLLDTSLLCDTALAWFGQR